MKLPAIFQTGKNQTDKASPSSSAGSPAYDATIHPAIADTLAVESVRLQQQRNLHLFGSKSAAALAFSHYAEGQPSPTAAAMMGLAAQLDLIVGQADRQWELPFPGVKLGHVPSFAAAPSTNPITPPVGPKSHHAHRIESRRATRARFGR